MTNRQATPTREKKLFKDWFDRDAANALADQFGAVHPPFDRRRFVSNATRKLADLTFSQRVSQFATALRGELPDSMPRTLRILTKSLPATLPDCEAVTDGWLQWPLGQLIADHGTPHFDESFDAMVELTKRFSAEFAVRPFAEIDLARCIDKLSALTNHESAHVRRWCSEGLRPRLPWGKKLPALIADPRPVLGILDALRRDPERYVQKSVANHLNDIAKDHPDIVIKTTRRWLKDKGCVESERWIIKQALRTLIKDGHPDALDIIGISRPTKIRATLTASPKTVSIDESVKLIAEIANDGRGEAELLIDYAVTFIRKNGKSSSKVFKWTRTTLKPGEAATLQKSHPFRTTTIRALYPGRHGFTLQVNGARLAETSVRLKL